MRNFLKIFMLLLLTAPVLAQSNADDAVVEAAQISAKVEKAFYARNFKAINEMTDALSSSKQRLSDGRWSASFLFSQLNESSYSSKNYDEWVLKEKIANEWVTQTPGHLAPYLASAAIELGYGWAIRGHAVAAEVSGERMGAFKRRVQLARQLLENPVFEKRKHPLWYLYMLDIGNLQSWDPQSYKTLFDAAVAAYPGYEFLYFNAARYFLPQWHGSNAALNRFVDEAVERTKATEGMVMYARLYWSQVGQLGDKTFDQGNARWAPMKQGFERLMKDYPTSKWNLNAFAYYACMARDWSTFSKLAPGVGDAPALAMWRTPSRYYTCVEAAKNAAK